MKELTEKQRELYETIKEVREYIKNMKTWDIEQDYDKKKLLEILDKGE